MQAPDEDDVDAFRAALEGKLPEVDATGDDFDACGDISADKEVSGTGTHGHDEIDLVHRTKQSPFEPGVRRLEQCGRSRTRVVAPTLELRRTAAAKVDAATADQASHQQSDQSVWQNVKST